MTRNEVCGFDEFLEEYEKHNGDAIRACYEIGVCGFNNIHNKYKFVLFDKLTSVQIKKLKTRALNDYLVRLEDLNIKLASFDKMCLKEKGTMDEVREHLFYIIRRYMMYPYSDSLRRDSLTASQLLQNYFKSQGGDDKEPVQFISIKTRLKRKEMINDDC